MAVLLLFFSKSKYPCSVNNYISNAALLIPIAIFLILFVLFIRKCNSNQDSSFIDKAVKISLPIIFVLQIYVFLHIYFESGWDAKFITNTARAIASGDRDFVSSVSADYFSKFQNNLLLALISGQLLKINSAIGIFGPDYDLMAIIVVNCAVSLLTAYLVYKILKLLVRDNRLALVGYIITLVLCTFSPWNVITYSDSLSLAFPVLVLYLYIAPGINTYVRWGLLAAVGYIGYMLKPTVAIIFIAIFGIQIIDSIYGLIKRRNLSFQDITHKTIPIALALLILITLNVFINYQYHSTGFVIDNSQKHSMYHFLMMGQNDVNGGVWYGDDVAFSRSFEDYETRKAAAKEVIVERIKSRGLVGQMDFTARKVLSDFNDGSFAWEIEGDFYSVTKPELTKASPFFRSIFYSSGENYRVFKITTHFFWFLTLCLVLVSVIGEIYDGIKNRRSNRVYLMILSALIGISMYNAIFETRARYLYVYVPVFIICAIFGLDFLCKSRFPAAEVLRPHPVSENRSDT